MTDITEHRLTPQLAAELADFLEVNEDTEDMEAHWHCLRAIASGEFYVKKRGQSGTDELQGIVGRLHSIADAEQEQWMRDLYAAADKIQRLAQRLRNVHAVLTESDHSGPISVYRGKCSDGVEREFVRHDQLAGQRPWNGEQ